MATCTGKHICVILFWSIALLAAIIVIVFPLNTFRPATCKITKVQEPEARALVNRVNLFSPSSDDEDDCDRPILEVLVKPKEEEGQFKANAEVYGRNCSDAMESAGKIPEGTEGDCWYNSEDTPDVRYLTESVGSRYDDGYARFQLIARMSVGLAILCAIFLLFAIFSALKDVLLRWCPRFLLTLLMKLQSFFFGRRYPPPPPPSPDANVMQQTISPPLVAVSRRRIAGLVEKSKLPENEIRNLLSDGWTCCICLEEQSDTQALPAVSRLACGHTMHSGCIQSWLEKGRSVCCLCNYEVFGNDGKENCSASPGTSFSGFEAGVAGSLDVERTEGAPSSLATSLFIELSQTRTTEGASSNGNDCPVDAERR